MLRKVLLSSLFMVGLSPLLRGGGTLSHPSNNESSTNEKNENVSNKYEPYKKEITTYLETLKLDDIITKPALVEHLNTLVNRDICDASKFPLFNAYLKELRAKNDREQFNILKASLEETVKQFIKQKKLPLENV
jgi:hypothetical protein